MFTDLMTNISGYLDALPAWFNAITVLVTAASGVTMLTKTKKDNIVLDYISKVLNVLALNVGKNLNADDPKAVIDNATLIIHAPETEITVEDE